MNDLSQNSQLDLQKENYTHFGNLKVTDDDRKEVERLSKISHFTGEEFSNLKDTLCGYSLKSTNTGKCPKCSSDLKRHYCDFVYVVKNLGMRVAYGPYGHFCNTCPTVVVDTDDLKVGILNHSHQRGFFRPIGLDLKGDLHLFREWNGKKPLFVIDDIDEQIYDVEDDDVYREKQRIESKALALAAKKLASKKKIQKKSKKKNRRK